MITIAERQRQSPHSPVDWRSFVLILELVQMRTIVYEPNDDIGGGALASDMKSGLSLAVDDVYQRRILNQ